VSAYACHDQHQHPLSDPSISLMRALDFQTVAVIEMCWSGRQLHRSFHSLFACWREYEWYGQMRRLNGRNGRGMQSYAVWPERNRKRMRMPFQMHVHEMEERRRVVIVAG